MRKSLQLQQQQQEGQACPAVIELAQASRCAVDLFSCQTGLVHNTMAFLWEPQMFC